MGKYEHASQEIEDIEYKIEMEYEKNWNELSRDEKNSVVLDHFFRGNVRYSVSSEELSRAIDAYRGNDIDDKGKVEKVTYKNGHSHYQIRESNGRFGRWIRE